MGVKMNFRIVTKNPAADSKKGYPLKIDFRADGTHESHPTACESKIAHQNPFLEKMNLLT